MLFGDMVRIYNIQLRKELNLIKPFLNLTQATEVSDLQTVYQNFMNELDDIIGEAQEILNSIDH